MNPRYKVASHHLPAIVPRVGRSKRPHIHLGFLGEVGEAVYETGHNVDHDDPKQALITVGQTFRALGVDIAEEALDCSLGAVIVAFFVSRDELLMNPGVKMAVDWC